MLNTYIISISRSWRLAKSGLFRAASVATAAMVMLAFGVALGIAALIGQSALSPAFAQTGGLGADDLVLRGDAVCTGCHNTPATLHGVDVQLGDRTCVTCHMPSRRTRDVINVTMTDHRIATGPFDLDALVSYLIANIQGRGKVTLDQCEVFYKLGSRNCLHLQLETTD